MRRGRILPLFRLGFGILALTASFARADPSFTAAPIGGGTPGTVRQLFLDPKLTDARPIHVRSFSLRLETANNWSVPATMTRGGHEVAVRLDSESDSLALTVRLPWSDWSPGGWRNRVASTVEWRVTAHWGGFEDGGIEAWHDLVGAYNFRRQRYARDAIHLILGESGATAFDIGSARFSLGDLVIGTQALLASGGVSRVEPMEEWEPSWGLTARFELKLPTGSLSSAGGSGGVDAGLSILNTRELTSWLVAHGMVFATVVSPLASRIALQPRRFHAGLDLSLVAVVGRWAFILENRLLTPLMESGWTVRDGGNDHVFISSPAAALFSPHNHFTIGVRYRRVTLSFCEDFALGSNPRAQRPYYYNLNSPDIVFALTYSGPLR